MCLLRCRNCLTSSGTSDALATTDLSGLDAALANNLSGLRDLFANTSTGLAVKLNGMLTSTIGEDGSLVKHQTALTKQSADIETQISNLEKQVLVYQDKLTKEFVAMETAQAKINQQLAYLQKTFFSSNRSSNS